MNNKLLIIDGTYLAYRSYFALNKSNIMLTDENGFSTNEVVLFFKSLFNLINEHRPTHLFVAFDAKEKTFRHQMYDMYKANRSKMEPSFYFQLDLIKQILSSLKIRNIEKNGYEADDIIAKLCFEYKNINKLIFSADQDLNQLIDEKTSIIKKNKDEYFILDNANFKTSYGIEPYQVVDYKAIIGDSSDNFSGIKGIGPKTASKLLNEYQNLENIYANLEDIKSTWASKFIEYKDFAFRNKVIAQLVFDFHLDDIKEDFLDLKNIFLSSEATFLIEKYSLNSIKINAEKLIKKLAKN
ncbi:DNA polymerase I: 5'-3' exonuclease domain protein [Metamycoplasma auris 15026]|uniref:5'-3' exonuclease n=1 Tax=Metamycoplasma auris 15026 TaxID=1188233 RepID=N9V1T5_9BACT|nr:5'-3' exonuclease H3TH domain-containing protein [Metamycoplasma auris]ENY69342.1 DNA polymerase I: 5'-3' exonuclease domain protein [Metamycoplasma auris 15026]